MKARSYLLVLLTLTLVIFGLYLLKNVLQDAYHLTHDCWGQGYSKDQFLAYCENEYYGDYEHGGYYFEFEPEAVRNLKQAEVVFLGNSRLMLALSTEATKEFFRSFASRRPFYLFGFGFGESHEFSVRILKKLDVHPKAIVINADNRFFEKGMSPVGKAIADEGDEVNRSRTKKILQYWHRFFCNAWSSACGKLGSIYRSKTDGTWNVQHWREIKSEAFKVPDDFNPGHIASYEDGVRHFLDNIDLPRECIILMSVPIPTSGPQAAETLARKFGLTYAPLTTSNEEWHTMDTAHLVPADAEIWSRHALPKLVPILAKCGVQTK